MAKIPLDFILGWKLAERWEADPHTEFAELILKYDIRAFESPDLESEPFSKDDIRFLFKPENNYRLPLGGPMAWYYHMDDVLRVEKQLGIKTFNNEPISSNSNQPYQETSPEDEHVSNAGTITSEVAAAIADKRWGPKKELKAQAILEAAARWENGSRLYHNEMAKELVSEDRFSELSKTALMKELIPYARKFSLVRGEKSMKKKK